jgi:hypothetical protein
LPNHNSPPHPQPHASLRRHFLRSHRRRRRR